MYSCEKCMKVSAIILLLLGLAFLAKDLGYWSFWNVSWWTALFLFLGVGKFGHAICPNCQKLRKKK